MRMRRRLFAITICSIGAFILFTGYNLPYNGRREPRDSNYGILSDNINRDLIHDGHVSGTLASTSASYNDNSSWLEIQLKNHITNSLKKEGKSLRSLYLRPFNTLYEELGLKRSNDITTRRRVIDVIRRGYGLEPYTSRKGEAGWIENGIVIKPWIKPKSLTAIEKKHPTPFNQEYETYVPFKEKSFFEPGENDDNVYSKKKIILWYTPTKYVQRSLSRLNPMRVCPEFPCYVTSDLAYVNQSSALVFSAQMVPPSPPTKRPGQVFVLHNHEPPYVNTFKPTIWEEGFKQKSWKKVFNWTMTYRMDSDIVVPYGLVRKRPKPVTDKNYKKIVNKKTKIVAWMVSNCETASEREKYVEELKKHVEVDVFGQCGDINCPRANDAECGKIIETNYKFYLSFESAICPDYITEKFFRALTMNTIVVARGDNQYFQHAPPEIFINTADFPSPKELARKMIELHKNKEAYIAMLKEKDKYVSLMEANSIRRNNGEIRFMSYRFELVGLCQLCHRLWNINSYRKQIDNIHEWFDRKMCRKRKDF